MSKLPEWLTEMFPQYGQEITQEEAADSGWILLREHHDTYFCPGDALIAGHGKLKLWDHDVCVDADSIVTSKKRVVGNDKLQTRTYRHEDSPYWGAKNEPAPVSVGKIPDWLLEVFPAETKLSEPDFADRGFVRLIAAHDTVYRPGDCVSLFGQLYCSPDRVFNAEDDQVKKNAMVTFQCNLWRHVTSPYWGIGSDGNIVSVNPISRRRNLPMNADFSAPLPLP